MNNEPHSPLNEEKIKKFFMHHIHESHLMSPIDGSINQEKKQAIFIYPLDMGSFQRIYSNWAYTIYTS